MMPIFIRIDATTLPALIFGGVLIIIALVMGVFVWRSRTGPDSAVESDPATRLHANRQFRRRIQISVMLGLIGLLIIAGDQMDQFLGKHPRWFVLWVVALMILVLWTVLMALGDWLSTFAYSAIARSNLRHERTALEDEIRRYHASKNGHSKGIDDQS
ncbi:MAG: hypothetical protein K2Z81_23695 [Cyanobacteria bacterium]|nr:hypothetical protein [Cyanobacteriota bacterium]